MIHLNVFLPHDRDHEGTMFVEQDGRLLMSFPAYGRGSKGKATNSQFLRNGDTPTGIYSGTFEERGGRNPYTYGEHGLVILTPVSGNAMRATQKNGRDGFRIHGGAKNPNGQNGETGLHATHGCLRVHNADMERLSKIIKCEKKIKVTVREYIVKIGI